MAYSWLQILNHKESELKTYEGTDCRDQQKPEDEDFSISDLEIGLICETVPEKDLSKTNKAYEKEVEVSLPCLGLEVRRQELPF